MTIIELAHIKLSPGLSASDPTLLSNLKRVKQVIENYNNLPTNFFAEHEDPSILYVVGAWDSQSQHADGFSGSAAQDEILALVKDQMDIDWMHYIDVDYRKIPMTSPALTIARYTLGGAGGREQQQQVFRSNYAAALPSASGNGPTATAGGWNLPKEGEKVALWVQFCGFSSVEAAGTCYADGPCAKAVQSVKGLNINVVIRTASMVKLEETI